MLHVHWCNYLCNPYKIDDLLPMHMIILPIIMNYNHTKTCVILQGQNSKILHATKIY